MLDHRSAVSCEMSTRGKATVIGSGVMGHGITIACALASYHVNMVDTSTEILTRALNRTNADFAVLVKNGLVTEEEAKNALARIRTTTSLAEGVDGAQFVTECITEDIAPKKKLFRDLDQLCPEDV